MGQRSGKTKDAVEKQEEKQEGKKKSVPYTNHALGCNVVMGQTPSKPNQKPKPNQNGNQNQKDRNSE